MITIQQVKAARALLDWKQSTLAKASGISLPAIAKLEQGIGSPRLETISAIRRAFENEGIEFIDNAGVSRRQEPFKVQVFDGHDAIFKIWADILETLKTGGDLMLSGLDERIWKEIYGKELEEEIRKRLALGITTRLLIREGDTYLVEKPEKYRWVPEIVFGQSSYYVYANKFVLINAGPPQKIVLIENASVADTFRRQFNFNWDHGKKVVLPKRKA